MALGFDDDEYLAARKDHAERLKLIAESQGIGKWSNKGGSDPAARGVPDLSADPNAGGRREGRQSQHRSQRHHGPAVRGKGRFTGRMTDARS